VHPLKKNSTNLFRDLIWLLHEAINNVYIHYTLGKLKHSLVFPHYGFTAGIINVTGKFRTIGTMAFSFL
jgi:hypothetical protein